MMYNEVHACVKLIRLDVHLTFIGHIAQMDSACCLIHSFVTHQIVHV